LGTRVETSPPVVAHVIAKIVVSIYLKNHKLSHSFYICGSSIIDDADELAGPTGRINEWINAFDPIGVPSELPVLGVIKTHVRAIIALV